MEDLKKLGYGTSLQNESAIGGTRALTIATGFDAGQQDNNPDNYPDDPGSCRSKSRKADNIPEFKAYEKIQGKIKEGFIVR